MEINDRQPIDINLIHYPVQVLGIGERVGIWFQGCSIGCKGCMARHTWQVQQQYRTNVGTVLREVISFRDAKPDGITISGGEPFDQPDALFELLMGIRNAGFTDIMLYSGYQFDALRLRYQYIVELVDVLIDGRYMQGIETDYVWKGSANQNANIITQDAMLRIRYSSYLKRRPHQRKLQIVEAPTGIYVIGIPKQTDMEAVQVVIC
ncbi:MAG: radical SAM protein [Nitrospirae bacterium]|uniref:4Fe-4S single cluster domain-containing protein n=1 Tax=Candidatus Magnetobacterium casense TaxID=1455061 RepID=UPI00058E42DD|nr:4Fe-4S single cluster domain-containing protein [Candidatus Magnetobacterium casensis]MBF0336779.1 radical SAM protein [Nitrospirota bacterium]